MDLAPYTLEVLTRDLEHYRGSMDGWDADYRDLWFWKAFIAWASIGCIRGGDEVMEVLLYKWIREWSATIGIRDWEMRERSWLGWLGRKKLSME